MDKKKSPNKPHEKFPLRYAMEICAMSSKEDRLAALEKVPEKYQELVKTTVSVIFERRKWAKIESAK